jgi:hypothetical protein
VLNGSTSIITIPAIGNALDISSGPEFTALWYMPESTTTTQAIVAHYNYQTASNQFVIGQGFAVGNDNQFTFVSGSGAGQASVACSSAVTIGQWYHIIGYIDPAGTLHGSPTVGLLITTAAGAPFCNTFANATFLSRNAGNSNLTIGNQSGTSYPATGLIAELAIYTILTTNQMDALTTICAIQSASRRSVLPVPLLYAPMTGASGTTTEVDLSGNHFNGAITSSATGNHAPCTP